MEVNRSTEFLHPILSKQVNQIQKLIDRHKMPFRLFETARTIERHRNLYKRGIESHMINAHLFIPLRHETVCAADFVFFDSAWSWNLRNQRVRKWYELLGQIVLDECSGIAWGGMDRRYQDYTHFELLPEVYDWRGQVKRFLSAHEIL